MKHFLLPLIFIFLFSFAVYGQSCKFAFAVDEATTHIGAMQVFSLADSGTIRLVTIRGTCPGAFLTTGSDWIKLTQTGFNAFSYFIEENRGATARTGAINYYSTQDSGTVFVFQDAYTCPVILSQNPASVSAASGSGTINVTTASNCNWQLRKFVDWITFDSVNGNGNASINYFTNTNPGNSRSAQVNINGQKITVNQESGCTFTPDATSATVPATETNGSFIVQAFGGCVWNRVSQVDWIAVTNGASWSGSGTLSYTVAANPLTTPRTGTITAGGNTFTITQAANAKSRKRTRFF